MRRVLLSTDFSKNAQHAIDYALLLLGEEKVQYFLLNSYGIVNKVTETLISIDDILHEQSEKGLQQSLQRIAEGRRPLDIKTISAHGTPPMAIKKVVSDYQIDMVVLGNSGGKAIRETMFGKTIAHLVRQIAQPMLIVPSQFPMKLPTKIVFATDLCQIKNLDVLNPMLDLAQKHQAQVIIMNVTGLDQDHQVKKALTRLDFNRHFEGIDYRFEVVENEDILDGISEYSDKNNIDLLVLSPKQYPYFKTLFHRSVTKAMIQRSDIPLLVV